MTEVEAAAKTEEKGKEHICVVGLGRIGLPTACLLAEAGFEVIGVDSNPQLLEAIKTHRPPFLEQNLDLLLENSLKSGRLTATRDLKDAASRATAILIAVPTLLDARKNPDYSILERVCKDIGSYMKKGTLIIVASTTGPGVTESLVKGALEKASGLKVGTDFSLACSPVRASVGQIVRDLKGYTRLVGGVDETSLNRAAAIISSISNGNPMKMKNMKTAEAVKVFENTYRAVNIALANELAEFCEEEGLNYFEVSDAANTQPFCHLHRPGIVGGWCIPVNPYFLIAEADDVDVDLPVITSAIRLNQAIPRHVVSLVADTLKRCGKGLKRARILILGASFKANVKDANNSTAGALGGLLKKRGARVTVCDPLFKASELEALGFKASPSLDEALEGADCVVVSVGHDQFRQQKQKILSRFSKKGIFAVVDCSGSNIFSPEDSTEKVICASLGVSSS